MIRALALTVLVGAVAFTSWRWGSFVAGGSDSACYAIQAVRWSQVLRHPLTASLQTPDPLALAAPWPDAAAAFAPTGHVASQTVTGAFVPICSAGLSIAMAPLYLVGGAPLMFAFVPFCGVMLILATYALGSRFNPRVGVAAAFLIAASPVFLYQVVQPMSDVPAATLWVAAVACATGTKRNHSTLAGLATSAAVLMRPNLVPLGFAIGLYLLFRSERSAPVRLRHGLAYAAWSAPGCLAVALIQRQFYGSPFASGYGSFEPLFTTSHVLPNLERYGTWLWAAQTPAIVLALLAPVVLPGALSLLLLALFAINFALFLPYLVFEDWSYLRFLLPTIPLILVLVAAVLDGLLVRLFRSGISPGDPRRAVRPAVALSLMIAVICGLFVSQAVRRHAFELRRMEARFARAGQFVGARLPANALVITDYESGSVPFYSGRPTLVWGNLDPMWIDRAVSFVEGRGFEPYLLFERWEEPQFRARFAGSPIGALDWPAMAEVATEVRIYRVRDRDRYRAGGSYPTEYSR